MNGRPFSISECISTCRLLFIDFWEVWESFLGGFLSHGGTPKSSISRWDFSWNKPSSYWGTPWLWKPPNGFQQDLEIQRRKLLENCGGILGFVVYAGYTQHHGMGLSKSHGNCCSFMALMGICWKGPRETSFCGETWIFRNQDHQQMIFHYSDPSLLRWPWLF